jgi:uncharacterized protein YndB with AHSA1/START domain
MVVLKNSVVIECTPEQAFEYLSDPRSVLEWNPACRQMVKLSDGPVGLGATYRAKWSNSPHVELETVAFDRPRSWSMHNGGPIEVSFIGRLEAVPEGTRLAVEFTPTPHGWFRLIFPLFLKGMRRQEQQNMLLIKGALERRIQRSHSAG